MHGLTILVVAGPCRMAAATVALTAAFKGRESARRRKAGEKALETLAAAGVAQEAGDGPDGGNRYFIPRQGVVRRICSRKRIYFLIKA